MSPGYVAISIRIKKRLAKKSPKLRVRRISPTGVASQRWNPWIRINWNRIFFVSPVGFPDFAVMGNPLFCRFVGFLFKLRGGGSCVDLFMAYGFELLMVKYITSIKNKLFIFIWSFWVKNHPMGFSICGFFTIRPSGILLTFFPSTNQPVANPSLGPG